MNDFRPVIIAFTCNWCAYAGADLAGTSRIQYPTNIRIIRLMCTGRLEPEFILEAFKLGADGVLVGGCHTGDCHYLEGNYKAAYRVAMVKEVLRSLGIEPERLRLEWISASEGGKFAEVVSSFLEEIRKLGPSPLKEFKGGQVEKDG
ncbi:MAG: hydrogenase iron-sulfur subunit [Candidatus Bathyarchaeia archaeon]